MSIDRRDPAQPTRRKLLPREGGRRATDPKVDHCLVIDDAVYEIERADRLLEIAAVAKRLKRCPETIRRYIRTGKLKANRPPSGSRGGNYLIAESAVSEFIATSCDTPRS